MVIRELNDFVKSYQSFINPLSPLSIPYQLLSIPYQSLITPINPLSTPITLLSPLSIQATPSPSTYSQDINRPRRDIKQLHDRNRRQTPRHEHLDRLLAPSLRTQRLQRRALLAPASSFPLTPTSSHPAPATRSCCSESSPRTHSPARSTPP